MDLPDTTCYSHADVASGAAEQEAAKLVSRSHLTSQSTMLLKPSQAWKHVFGRLEEGIAIADLRGNRN